MRDNQEWVQELRGDRGGQQQEAAHCELANYLYVVAYNYLRIRQADLRALAAFPVDDLAALAQDFVQETLEKLARNQFALLATYSGAGKFTSWAAQIVRNQAAQELRKSYWTRRNPLPASSDPDEDGAEPLLLQRLADTSDEADPARRAQQTQVAATLQGCLAGLSERYRLAVLNCLGDNVPAEAVARALDTTANAVYLIIQRAKRKLRQCLERAGLDKTVLAVFA
ncbi:MAG: sigma-70 family RNA polymerase sigma factor [Anaerolineae bacterium]|nr:sigma-70 family RNA polymerase sigma factor [Anaerolineae bacterium]MCB0256156.1 sigma-70 family RNA polymerase sigma factor [Anaerolineae bacterium]